MTESAVVFLKVIPVLVLSAVFHEVSHGWVALRFGDRTAQQAGRLTLNPFRHMDPIGTVLVPLVLYLLRSPFLFAWAKPVPIHAASLRHPRRDMLWVAAAGPLVNYGLAVVGALGLRLFGSLSSLWGEFFVTVVLINVLLGTFNLVPIPPLDGSRVLMGLVPVRFMPAMIRLERWGMPVLLLLLFLGVFRAVLMPVVFLLTYALLRGVGVEVGI